MAYRHTLSCGRYGLSPRIIECLQSASYDAAYLSGHTSTERSNIFVISICSGSTVYWACNRPFASRHGHSHVTQLYQADPHDKFSV